MIRDLDCRKKVLSLAVSATGQGRLEEISQAFVDVSISQYFTQSVSSCPQLVEDFQQRAVSAGSEDSPSVATLQRCEELLPGEVGQVNQATPVKCR